MVLCPLTNKLTINRVNRYNIQQQINIPLKDAIMRDYDKM